MINSESDSYNIKRIVDPKSGFSLYLKNQKGVSIPEVSTYASFPIPSLGGPGNDFSKTIKELQKMITELSSQQEKSGRLSKDMLKFFEKRHKTQIIIILGLIVVCFFSILF